MDRAEVLGHINRAYVLLTVDRDLEGALVSLDKAEAAATQCTEALPRGILGAVEGLRGRINATRIKNPGWWPRAPATADDADDGVLAKRYVARKPLASAWRGFSARPKTRYKRAR